MAGAAISGAYSEPEYISYGGGGGSTVYEGGETIVVNDSPQPVQEYAQQATDIAGNYDQLSQQVTTPPPATAEAPAAAPTPEQQAAFTEDWKPLGIYAITEDNSTADPTRYVQLLVSKSGAIGGELHDLTADTSTPVYGAVDPKSQRVAWKVGTSDTVMETGLYNLTQTETPLLIHQGKGKTQQLTMARIEDPALMSGAGAAGTSQPTNAP